MSFIAGAEFSDVSLVDFDRHLIRDFSPGRSYGCCCCCCYFAVTGLVTLSPNRDLCGPCLTCTLSFHRWCSRLKVGYRGGSPTAVQAWRTCPLWEPST